MTAQQSRDYAFVGPRDYRPPSQRNPGPKRTNNGAPPPAVYTDYNKGGRSIPAQILGPGVTPKGKSIVPKIARPRHIYRPPTSTEWGDNYRRLQAAARFAKLLRRMNPYMNALDIGFNLLGDWASYGPQSEETPGGYQFPSEYVQCASRSGNQDIIVLNGLYSSTSCAPPANQLYNNQAVPAAGRWFNIGDTITLPAGWERGHLIIFGQRSLPQRYDQMENWHLPIQPVGYNKPIPYVPAQPGRKTVQRSPTSVVPPLPVTHERDTPPRQTARPETIIGTLRPLPPVLPSERPANTIEVSPGGVFQPPQKPHVLAPPAPGGKELKFNVQKGSPLYKAIGDLYNGVTEAGDFMEVLADSLEGNPCKGLKLAKLTYCIGENLHKVDLDAFIEGLIYNHFEDQVIGTFLSWGSKSPYGVQTPTTAPARRPHYARRPYVYRGNPNG